MNQILQFGGGKDSLACLYYLEPEWQDTLVVWMNTGAAFTETIELMDRVRQLVPHFHEVRSDVFADIEQRGFPTDLPPVANHPDVQRLLGTDKLRLRSWLECCNTNMWLPLQTFCLSTGITTIIRGQRLTEHYKSDLRDGAVIDGITYRYPLQNWTEDQVFEFLHKRGVPIPSYYEWTGTSLDCWNCTAYMDAKVGQLKYMKEKHPEKYAAVKQALEWIQDEIDQAQAPINEALEV